MDQVERDIDEVLKRHGEAVTRKRKLRADLDQAEEDVAKISSELVRCLERKRKLESDGVPALQSAFVNLDDDPYARFLRLRHLVTQFTHRCDLKGCAIIELDASYRVDHFLKSYRITLSGDVFVNHRKRPLLNLVSVPADEWKSKLRGK